MEKWRPLSIRGTPEGRASYDTLHDGIPDWLTSSVLGWIGTTLELLDHHHGNPEGFLQRVERTLRVAIPRRRGAMSESPAEAERRYLQELAAAHPEKGLDLIDFLLRVMRDYRLPQLQSLAAGLEEVLAGGGSAWRVAADCDGLERRVSEEVAFRAREEMSADTKVAAHVRVAWTDVYGRHPNPSQGYREAVKAVEAAAIPVICPNDPTATLGKIIGQLRARPDMWATSLSPQGRDGIDLAIGMLELIWKSQLDRHGTPDANVPISVSLEEAEAALHLALTLVHWFRTGAIRKKP